MRLATWVQKKILRKIFILYVIVIIGAVVGFTFFTFYVSLKNLKEKVYIAENWLNEVFSEFVNDISLFSELYSHMPFPEQYFGKMMENFTWVDDIYTFSDGYKKIESHIRPLEKAFTLSSTQVALLKDNKTLEVVKNKKLFVIIPRTKSMDNTEIFHEALIFEISPERFVSKLTQMIQAKNLGISLTKPAKVFTISYPGRFHGYTFYVSTNFLKDYIGVYIYIFPISFAVFVVFYIYFSRVYLRKQFKENIEKPVNSIMRAINIFEERRDVVEEDISGLDEFSIIYSELYNMMVSISAGEQELEMSLDEINSLREKLEDINNKLIDIYQVLRSSDPNLRIEEFSQNILEKLVDQIPGADAGSIILKFEDGYHFTALVGFSENLKSVVIENPEHIAAMNLDGHVGQKEFLEFHNRLPENVKQKLNISGTSKIRSSYFVPIYVLSEKVGAICFDSFNNDTIDIPPYIVEIFSRVVGGFLYLKSLADMRESCLESIILTFAEMAEMKEPYMKGHSKRVGTIARYIAKEMGFEKSKCDIIWRAAILHDIGKMGINEVILNKKEPLSKNELKNIRKHPVYGYKLLENIKPLIEEAKILLYHHERWDGKGYPERLREEEIPVESRIISIAESFDVMVIDKPYKKALSINEAKEIFQNEKGQWDPEIVKVFLKIIDKVYEDVYKNE
ncbi:HD-GYP domain-containing protein [Thermosipho ferrireducens]|uniref:HD-GYP domain-containing protein n=1 Tax=Thermosipho ferrireducens TaxID=2571116 RepID=A0ABX7S6Q6_9BACT|nr:HD-GYP domain-containing protein [Thermosipho ferrireducens]QTA38254.1 HD-GYP domain-containing protein [Thermosipho ferrireducens]